MTPDQEHQLRERFRFATIAEKQTILVEQGLTLSEAFGIALIAESVMLNGSLFSDHHRQGKLFP